MGVRGQIRNLDAVLREFLHDYDPGAGGVDGVSDKAVVTFPVEIAWFPFLHTGATSSIPAGEGGTQNIYTVPADEIHRVHLVHVERASGDNQLDTIVAQFPGGYRNNLSNFDLLNIANATGGARIYWPDPSGQQSPYFVAPTPILLPPATSLIVNPAGVGVAASVFNVRIYLERCKAFRAIEPDPD